ncbi:MAG: hypothetical protein OXR67_05845 [Chloroflexota bacterium]|nr:hypothetical protein [Chloroflexota bacterium]
MSAAELTAIAGIGMATAAIYRMGKLSEATARIPQEITVELQRIHDRIGQHETLNGEQFLRNQELIRHNEELIRHNGELIRRVEELVRIEAERTREQIGPFTML